MTAVDPEAITTGGVHGRLRGMCSGCRVAAPYTTESQACLGPVDCAVLVDCDHP